MATLRKRNGKWQVQVRRQGHSPVSKSFINRKDAEAWARDVERRLDQSEALPARQASDSRTLGDLLVTYRDKITPHKKSASVERYRIDKILRHSIANTQAAKLMPAQVASYRDERLESVSGETTRQDLVLLRQVLDVARREWGLKIAANPVDDVRKPPPAKARTRRVHFSDLRAIAKGLQTFRNPLLRHVILFALATGMRRGEILRVEWQHVDQKQALLTIPVTKNGHPRTIPLSRRALKVLADLSVTASETEELVFPISANAVRLSWQRLRTKAGLNDLRFHDIRHEAVSRFFEAGLTLPEVALISGHRDPKMLLRYTHLDPRKIAAKL
ncbi:tyrosine-type recombinase/integrase [Agrobacterium sp. MA01]|uniref:site-specific integrase n=1 Tax=Agrobacterium sp. MA01 TaxID=2664893 RepID=UPI00129B0196|nr:site-specific integrase [Agrobacterium sp. MA01]QGG89026.1 tyrosine-type recombinase/integrase [Agrobacterium sp. MA01]